MSCRISRGRGGRFAGAPRGMAGVYDFVLAQRTRGVPATAVALMTGRSVGDVRAIYDWPALAPAVRTHPVEARPCAKGACVRALPARALRIVRPLLEAAEVSLTELQGPSRRQRVVAARRQVYLALHEAGVSASVIGSYFGGRGRSGVAEAIALQRRLSSKSARGGPVLATAGESPCA